MEGPWEEKRERILRNGKGKKQEYKGLSNRNVTVNIEREKQILRGGRYGKMNRLFRGERCNLALKQITKMSNIFLKVQMKMTNCFSPVILAKVTAPSGGDVCRERL